MKILQVGKYQVQQLIGRGSFGTVYKGCNKITQEKVALKFIEKKGKENKELESLNQQIEILKKLKHMNIIQLKDHVTITNEIILITQFAGTDLSIYLQQNKKLSEHQIRIFLIQIVDALIYLNQNRIVHRDLKPQNILINQNNILKICDFGFAKKLADTANSLHSIKGTPLYIAPEILQGKHYNFKVDVWSLGIILFQLFTGKPPFLDVSFQKLIPKILKEKVNYPADMSLEFRQLIEGMLQKSQKLRFTWNDIKNHPFLKKQEKIVELLQKLNLTDSNCCAFSLSNSISIDSIQNYQQKLKQGILTVKQIRKDYIFYNKVLIIVNGFNNKSQNYEQLLKVIIRILIMITVKQKPDGKIQNSEDIIYKKDLILGLLDCSSKIEQQSLICQCMKIICYLLKINFNMVSIDCHIAHQIIANSIILTRPTISLITLSHLMQSIGILFNQIIMTYENSKDTIKQLEQYKIVQLMLKKFKNEKSYAIIFECLQKIIHPQSKKQINEQPLQELRQECAQQLIIMCREKQIYKIKDIFSYNELMFFFHVFYECIKISSDFRKEFLKIAKTSDEWNQLFNKSKLSELAINKVLLVYQNQCLINIENLIRQFTNPNTNQIFLNYQIYLISRSQSNQIVKNLQLVELLIKKSCYLLNLNKQTKIEYRFVVQGNVNNNNCIGFDNEIIQSILYVIKNNKNLINNVFKILKQNSIVELIISKHAQLQNNLNELLEILFLYISESQLSWQKVEKILILLDSINNQFNNKKFQQGFSTFLKIVKTLNNNYNKLPQFCTFMQNSNIIRNILTYSTTEQSICQTLAIIYKLINKPNIQILHSLSVKLIETIRPYFKTQNIELLTFILRIISHLARINADNYSTIEKSGIVEFIPNYMKNRNDKIVQLSLNLIGNLSKHSNLFIDAFEKYQIVKILIKEVLRQQNTQKLMINANLAIGNISFFTQKFKQYIILFIPYLFSSLFINQERLIVGAITTLTNLLKYSDYYIQEIINKKILLKLNIIFKETTNKSILNHILSFLKKLLTYKCYYPIYGVQELKLMLSKKQEMTTDNQINSKIAKLSKAID